MARGSLSPEADGYTLTSDANIIHVRATIKYHVTEPLRYAFAFTNAPAILTNVVNNAIFRASARTTANAALHEDKTGFRDLVLSLVRQKIEELNLGIELEPSDVETKAPADVRLAFDAVVNASLDRGKTISDARGYYDRLTRTAGGEADKTIGEGLVQSNRWVQAVTADARAFGEQLPHYRSDPGLFQQRMLLATMQRVLTNAQEKFFLPERPAGLPREVRLLLSREPEKIEAKEPR
jgi:membrane protease subunit HflK